MHRATPLAAALLLAACADRTDPVSPARHAAAPAPSLAALDDALGRVVPALTDREGAAAIARALGALRDHAARGDEATLRGAAEALRRTMAAHALRSPGDAADLDAIALAVGPEPGAP